MNTILAILGDDRILTAILGVAMTSIAGAAARFAIRHAWLRGFLERLAAERWVIARMTQQTIVDGIKRGRAPDSDGGVRLTAAEAEEVITKAVVELEAHLGITALDHALEIMKLPRTPAFIRRYLRNHVEAEVKELSIQAAAADNGHAAGASSPPIGAPNGASER